MIGMLIRSEIGISRVPRLPALAQNATLSPLRAPPLSGGQKRQVFDTVGYNLPPVGAIPLHCYMLHRTIILDSRHTSAMIAFEARLRQIGSSW